MDKCTDMKVSIVCCYNNEKQYKRFCRTIKGQDIPIKIIGINNCKDEFKCCSEAYNYAINKVESEYVIFSHQDIEFLYSNTVSTFVYYLEKLNKNDILGVAGRKEAGTAVITNIRHGKNSKYAGRERITGMEKCQTIDECFFGGTSVYFKENPFDTLICNNWHLLGAEQCLRTIITGGNVYVCDIELVHFSNGKITSIYNYEFYLLLKKYKDDFKVISTPCRSSRTGLPYRAVNYVLYTFRMVGGNIISRLKGRILSE